MFRIDSTSLAGLRDKYGRFLFSVASYCVYVGKFSRLWFHHPEKREHQNYVDSFYMICMISKCQRNRPEYKGQINRYLTITTWNPASAVCMTLLTNGIFVKRKKYHMSIGYNTFYSQGWISLSYSYIFWLRPSRCVLVSYVSLHHNNRYLLEIERCFNQCIYRVQFLTWKLIIFIQLSSNWCREH